MVLALHALLTVSLHFRSSCCQAGGCSRLCPTVSELAVTHRQRWSAHSVICTGSSSMSRENQGTWNPAAESQVTRFAAGTCYASTYKVPPQSVYAYKALPASHLHRERTGSAKLDTRNNLFPTLTKSVAAVKVKLAPAIGDVVAALRGIDTSGSGFVTEEELVWGIRHAGILLSESDFNLLVPLAKRDHSGRYDYVALADTILGRDEMAAAEARLHCGTQTYSWETDAAFEVALWARSKQPTFLIPAWRMQRFAEQATKASQQFGHPGKVALVMNELLREELIELPETANPVCEADLSRTGAFDLSFRQWIYEASTNSLSETKQRIGGPGPLEVADIFAQIVHDGLGVLRVTSHMHTQPALFQAQ